MFQTRGPAAAKLLSPNVLCVRGTAHDLSVDERSRRHKYETCQFEVDTSLDKKQYCSSLQLTQNWRDVVPSSMREEDVTSIRV